MIEFDIHDVLLFGFKYRFDTQYILCFISRYHLILDKFYVTFQSCHL